MDIRLRTERGETKEQAILYQKALDIKSAIPHPRIMGVIRECGGKMHMRGHRWTAATTDFFEVGVDLMQKKSRLFLYWYVFTKFK